LLLVAFVFADVTIGTGTSTQRYPFSSYYKHNRSAAIYLQSEIGEATTIAHLAWYVNIANTTTDIPLKIYLKHTDAATQTAANWASLTADATLVYDATHRMSPIGWFEFDITDFSYNGTDNLMVLTESDGVTFSSPYPEMRYTSTSSNYRTLLRQSDTIPYDSTVNLSTSYNRPNIMLISPVTTPPTSAINPFPAHQATMVGLNPKLTWTSDQGSPNSYDVYFGPSDPPAFVGNHPEPFYNVTGLNRNEEYFWKVVPINDIGMAEDCPVWSFTTIPEGLVVIGDDAVENLNLPINPYFNYNYSQTVYLQSEIDLPGQQIERLYYYWGGTVAGTNIKDWSVYMGHTDKSAFASTSDWVPFENLTPVFDGEVNILANNPGWVEIILDTPFVYHNTNNLVIAVNETTPLNAGNYAKFVGTGFTANRGLRVQRDSSAYDPALPGTGTLVAGIANIRMQFGELPPNPVFAYSPSSLSFPNAVIGNTSDWQNVTVSNQGQGTISLSTADIELIGADAAEFEFDDQYLPAELTATEPLNIPVRFTAPAIGDYSATLRLRYNGTDYDVALSGSGAAPFVNMSNGSTTLAAEELWNFYDSGGLNGQYGSSENLSYTFNPPAGYRCIVEFSAFNTEANYDKLYIYDGVDATGTLIGTYSGTSLPPSYTANLSGSLTFVFTSDYSGVRDGWAANITSETLPVNPVFSISPTAWDFNDVDVNATVVKTFTVANAAGGSLGIQSIVKTSGDTDYFEIANNSYVNPLEGGQSFTFDVEFTPIAAADYEVVLTITDDQAKATHSIVIAGTGWVPPAGTDCNNPYPVTLPLVDFIDDTALYGDDYESNWVTPAFNYLGGDDMVLQFMLDVPSTLEGTLTALTGTWIGMAVVNTCPDPETPAPVLATATSTSGTVANLAGVELPAGSYFLIISSWPTPQSVEFKLNLSATPLPTDPIFSINPTEWDYSSVQVDTEIQKTFTITNTGGGTLFIDRDDISIIGDDYAQFILSPIAADISLENNATTEIIVTFNPGSLGLKSASIQIVDNTASSKKSQRSGAKATQSVALTGTGFDATIANIPHIQTWDVPAFMPGWAIHNLNDDAYTWEFVADGGSNVAKIRYNGSMAMDDWLISPPIILEAGIDYIVSYKYRCYSATNPEMMKVAFGNAQNPSAMTEVIADHVDFTNTSYETTYTIPFTPSVDGTFYLGFHGYSPANRWSIYLDDIRILLPNTQIAQVIATSPTASVTIPAITVGEAQISPEVAFANLSGNPVIQVSTSCGVTADPLTSERLVFTIDGSNLAGVGLSFIHGLGFIPQVLAYQLGAGDIIMLSNPGDWTNAIAYFTVPAAKGPYTLKVIFPKYLDDTLPVELSSFTAVLTADLHVNIAWTTESETNHAGYNVLRSEVKELSTAIMINGILIDEGSVNGTQVSYQYTDTEVYRNARYYYWLEDRSLSGESKYHGPLMVSTSAEGENELPGVPVETKLFSAFPNPFNPATNLRYSVREAGEVQLEIYNVKGQLVRNFKTNHNQPGYYQVKWDGRDTNGHPAATGVYFYRMSNGKYTSTKKMVMTK